MTRNQTSRSSVQNIFALNRVRKECYYEPIRVDFSPIERPNNLFESIIPFFNNDNNYFTPAFTLKKQKTFLSENLLLEKTKFEARISHSEMPSQEQTPQHRPTDSKYCQLCNEYFADYWEHINDKYHKRMINSSKFNKDIMALCKSFETENKSKNINKTKKIEKNKVTKKPTKLQKLKNDEIETKQSQQKVSLEMIKVQTITGIDRPSESMEFVSQKNESESLKIMLQIGNYSTNILSDNAFKQLCQQP